MDENTQEAQQQHMMLIVESAQRAGYTESEIGELVDEAVQADAELERAA